MRKSDGASRELRVRNVMVWPGATMFLSTLPVGAVAAFVGGPMAVAEPDGSQNAVLGELMLYALPLVAWAWLVIALWCVVRRPRRTEAERLVVAARQLADAEREASEPLTLYWTFAAPAYDG